MNKKIFLLILICLQISICSAVIPKIEPYVNDYAHLLTADEITRLNIQADNIEKNTTYEIALVTIQTTDGLDRVTFANKIGDENGVGKKGKDNGIVVLWSMDNERGGAIATGRFSESILNDAKVARIGRESRPYFDNGSYYLAFDYVLKQINYELTNQAISNSTAISSNQANDSGGQIIFVVIVLVFIVIIYLSRSNAFSGGGGIGEGIVLGSILSKGGRGSSGGGGFSGGSFGGGSFGGGGSKF